MKNIEKIIEQKEYLEGDIEELVDKFQNLMGVNLRDITIVKDRFDNTKISIGLKLIKEKEP